MPLEATLPPESNDPPTSATAVKAGDDSKRTGIIGLAVIVLGNAATLTGSIEKVNEQVQRIQEQLHLGTTPYLLYAVLAAILFGYILTSQSLYAHFGHKLRARFRGQSLAVGGLVLVSMGTLFALNLKAIPNAPNTILQARKDIWIDKIRDTQMENGGFSIMLWRGPSNPVQVFTTAQGLAAIVSAMDWEKAEQKNTDAIRAAFSYIDSARRNGDGGWGYFDTSQPLSEIAAWVTVARAKALQHADLIWSAPADQERQLNWLQHDIEKLLMSAYVPSESAWSPFVLMSGGPGSVDHCSTLPPALLQLSVQPPTRTYSTLMALWALLEAHQLERMRLRIGHRYDDTIRNAIGWLLATYSTELKGWVPNPHRPNQREDYLGLTGQVMDVLYIASAQREFRNAVEQPRWIEARRDFLDKPIKQRLLGDNSHLSDMDGYIFPSPQPLEPMTFLWAPWSLAACANLSNDAELSAAERKIARDNMEAIAANYASYAFEKVESGGTYELAENLVCVSQTFSHVK
jgi:hypothetical protein